MLVAFELSMPNRASWNGKWSGEERRYVRVVNVGASKKAREKYQKLVGRHHYSFGDGWVAAVGVREVERSEAGKLRRASNGFCGYDWMIESLRMHGEIRP
jgi:hypothetical protein